MEILRPLGVEYTFEEYDRQLTGQTDLRSAQMFLQLAGKSDGEADSIALRNEKRAVYRSRNRKELSLGQGIAEIVAGLVPETPVGLVTSSVRTDVEPVLQDQGLFPHLLFRIYGDDVTRHKPDPEPYLLALDKLRATHPNIEPGDVLVLEDSAAGHASATAAGCRVEKISDPGEVAPLLASLFAMTA